MLEEFIDFLKFESRYGLRVVCTDLIKINKLYFKNYYINKLLDISEKKCLRFTFFIRSKGIKNKLNLIKRINKLDHEIASHGHMHVLYENKSKEWLTNELTKSKSIFNKLGLDVRGFRSPFFSDNDYLYEVLEDLNFKYASNKFVQDKIKSNLTHTHITYPSDWHGIIVERWNIDKILKIWSEQKGTLALHPWIFHKHFNKFENLIGKQKDLRIISNLNNSNLKISFDLY